MMYNKLPPLDRMVYNIKGSEDPGFSETEFSKSSPISIRVELHWIASKRIRVDTDIDELIYRMAVTQCIYSQFFQNLSDPPSKT